MALVSDKFNFLFDIYYHLYLTLAFTNGLAIALSISSFKPLLKRAYVNNYKSINLSFIP